MDNLQSFYSFLIACSLSSLTIEAMILLRRIITVACIVASFIAKAGEQFTTKDKCAVNPPTNTQLQLIHGTWEGVQVGEKAHQKITITITDNSLNCHSDTKLC